MKRNIIALIALFVCSCRPKFYLVKGRLGEDLSRICKINGMNNVEASVYNIGSLLDSLFHHSVASAYVSGWNGVRMDLVLRDNGALAPFTEKTNYANHAFCYGTPKKMRKFEDCESSGDLRAALNNIKKWVKPNVDPLIEGKKLTSAQLKELYDKTVNIDKTLKSAGAQVHKQGKNKGQEGTLKVVIFRDNGSEDNIAQNTSTTAKNNGAVNHMQSEQIFDDNSF